MDTYSVLARIHNDAAAHDLVLSALPGAPIQAHVERAWLPRFTVTRLSLPVPTLKRPAQVTTCS